MMLRERLLGELSAAVATRFVTEIFGPEERFARAFHHYWRVVLGLDEITARHRTQDELAAVSRALLDDLADPHMHVLEDQVPIALFGYRALCAHAYGPAIRAAIDASGLGARCSGPLGIAHCVGILDAHASIDLLKRIFAAIARKATARGHEQIFFFTSDHRLGALYRRFGMEFPPALALRDSQHLVGLFDLTLPANQARLAALYDQLDAPALSVAA